MIGYTVPDTCVFKKINLCFIEEETEALEKLTDGTQVKYGSTAGFKGLQLV